jgi:hypothetical protein
MIRSIEEIRKTYFATNLSGWTTCHKGQVGETATSLRTPASAPMEFGHHSTKKRQHIHVNISSTCYTRCHGLGHLYSPFAIASST